VRSCKNKQGGGKRVEWTVEEILTRKPKENVDKIKERCSNLRRPVKKLRKLEGIKEENAA
jgi:hypothetical protein